MPVLDAPAATDWELETAKEIGPQAVADLLNKRESAKKAPKLANRERIRRERLAVAIMLRYGKAIRLMEEEASPGFNAYAYLQKMAGTLTMKDPNWVAYGLTIQYAESTVGFDRASVALRRVYVDRTGAERGDRDTFSYYMRMLAKRLKTDPIDPRAMPNYEAVTQGPITESERAQFEGLKRMRVLLRCGAQQPRNTWQLTRNSDLRAA